MEPRLKNIYSSQIYTRNQEYQTYKWNNKSFMNIKKMKICIAKIRKEVALNKMKNRIGGNR